MQAPTDNLYKFLSISGLICLLFFIFDANNRSEALGEKINGWRMEQAILEVQVGTLKSDVEGFDASLESAAKNGIDKELLKEFRSGWDINNQKLGEIKITRAKIKLNSELAQEGLGRLHRIWWQYGFLGSASFVLFVLGMCLWYFKTQRYIDLKEAIIPSATIPNKIKDKLPRRG
jgi:hypothetical protein